MLQHAYARTHASRRPARPHTTAISLVAAIHAVLIFGLINALKPTTKVDVPPPPIQTSFQDDVRPNDIPPPPPPRRADAPEPVVPIPDDFIIFTPTAPGPTAITPPTAPTPTVPGNPPAVILTPARPLADTQTGPAYPIISRRLGEEGTVLLRLTVTAEGRVSEAMLLESSGFSRLDEAAINWVVRNWRYEPAMEGARAVESMVEASLTFRLER